MDLTEIQPPARVRHWEYGDGTVEVAGSGYLVIHWDKPMPDSMTHRLTHHLSFADSLELIPATPRVGPH